MQRTTQTANLTRCCTRGRSSSRLSTIASPLWLGLIAAISVFGSAPAVKASNSQLLAATPVSPETQRQNSASKTSLTQGTVGPRVKELQQQLKQKGYDPGPVDGVFGLKTKIAVAAFQKSQGLVVDGVAGTQTLAALGIKPQVVLPVPNSTLNPRTHDSSPVLIADQLYWSGSEGNLGLMITGKFTSAKNQADAFNLLQDVGTFQEKTWKLSDILVAADFNANGRVATWKVSGPRPVIAQYLDALRAGYNNRSLLYDFGFSYVNFQPSAAVEP